MKTFDRVKPKVENEKPLNISTHFVYEKENQTITADNEYKCESRGDIKDNFAAITNEIDTIEATIGKKISTIKINMSGFLEGQNVNKQFNNFHDFRQELEPVMGHIVQCNFGWRR